MHIKRTLAPAALALSAALALVGCGSTTTPAPGDSKSPAQNSSAPAPAASTVTIEDNNGSHTVTVPPTAVVATDNRTFQTLDEWGIELKAAARALMPNTVSYAANESIIDLGTHGEPDLEAVVAVQPDLIVNGQRFTQFAEQFQQLVPNALVLNLDPREDQPLDAELKRQTTVLGEIFGKQAEAKKLNDDLDAAIARAKAAYDPSAKVMAVNTSGGNIGYLAPGVGRTLGPVFGLLGLTPALEVEGTDDHQGDDISVEAIAGSNPDWILVMDRDAGVAADDPNFQPAADLLANSQALANVTAIKEGHVVIMPPDTYLNEGIQTYTKFFNQFADALEGKS
ncbi:MAG: ABC transporter substrate-binding protein [Tessaracoccus sp.]|uniref:siderophore ABC transporter substrate-binding protein n=1 Tax=Tessaracoccus sp. TaxID=1971211 RepID=UPI001EBA9E40|nr:ABC transporter substrate-binding protein [Tessaracoccus sp.]MBK7819661.1 ABC transporter substrate-binding protein [Tessaracoccus sp.]